VFGCPSVTCVTNRSGAHDASGRRETLAHGRIAGRCPPISARGIAGPGKPRHLDSAVPNTPMQCPSLPHASGRVKYPCLPIEQLWCRAVHALDGQRQPRQGYVVNQRAPFVPLAQVIELNAAGLARQCDPPFPEGGRHWSAESKRWEIQVCFHNRLIVIPGEPRLLYAGEHHQHGHQ